ncbi:hypothetical protein KAJ83_06830 [Marivibrio halodurans]|uniref:Uncharacterized protein n=1 Tax=Marivibrio halodurans TaxID=2039722 RepID=A0A8J7SM58_9PROT|nr:hypothetical protein [Marivibrio halodurans]MBP5856716.1 hypothetical protein [Marivibrio halodurans]
MRRIALPIAAAILALAAAPVLAGGADVSGVEILRTGDNTYRFTVTVRHDDEGWDHYADAFVIESMDGEELGRRTLHHPHVDELPFTRSLSGVTIPADHNTVTVRAHDSVHGFTGRGSTVILPD